MYKVFSKYFATTYNKKTQMLSKEKSVAIVNLHGLIIHSKFTYHELAAVVAIHIIAFSDYNFARRLIESAS